MARDTIIIAGSMGQREERIVGHLSEMMSSSSGAAGAGRELTKSENGFQCQDCGSLKFSIRHDIYRANKSYKDVLAGSVRELGYAA